MSERNTMPVLKPTYVIYVCGNCGSNNIVAATENDALCGDCDEWMNTETVTVAPVEDAQDQS